MTLHLRALLWCIDRLTYLEDEASFEIWEGQCWRAEPGSRPLHDEMHVFPEEV